MLTGIPLLLRALGNMDAFLKKAEDWAKENNVPAEHLLQAKLAEDMLPLVFQVQTCSNTAKAVLPRLAGIETAEMEDKEQTFEDLHARIQKTVDILKSAEGKQDAFAGKEDQEVKFMAGPYELKFTGLTYLQNFVLPNFFFHETTLYAILRKEGAPVGKMDFLGKVV